MIKLKDLIPNNIHDPFTGEIHEGLIQTVEINKALDIIKKQFKDLQEFSAFDDGRGSISIEFRPKYVDTKTQNYTGNYPDPNISKILVLLNNLGYFPSLIQYRLNNSSQKPKSSFFPSLNKDVQQYSMKYNSSKFRDLVKDEEPPLLIFDFETKYDPTVIPPQFIYHITNSNYVDNIKKIGLKPKSLNKRSTHTERIYFSLDESKSKALWNNLKYDLPKGKGVLLTIDTEGLTNTFYNDPNFSGKGIYTYENIPPQNVIKYEPITEN